MSSQSHFPQPPKRPSSDNCQNTYIILCNAHSTSNSFCDAFSQIRQGKKGTLTDNEQDLLRAMLIFASSGLDTLVKQLVKDALPHILDIDPTANDIFRTTFVERKIKSGREIDGNLLANVLTDEHPRRQLIKLLIDDLTSRSLQSTEELNRATSYFNIPSKEIIRNTKLLTEIFQVRNQVVHEMDIDLSQSNRNRRPRKKQKMIEYTREIFHISKTFLYGVDKRSKRSS